MKMDILLTEDPRFQPLVELLEGAKYEEALHYVDSLLGRLSVEDRLVALYWKASCLTWLDSVNEARRCLEEALARIDDHNPLRVCLELQGAFLLRDERGPESAALEIRSLLKRYEETLKSPSFFWIYARAKTYLGNCLSLASRYSEAIKELEEALSLEVQHLSRYYAQFWLADAYYQVGELSRAKEHFEYALKEAELAPEAGLSTYYAARLRYELALIAQRQRRFAEAERELERASAIGSHDAKLLQVIERLRGSLKDSTSEE
jgi:tetratricopeptide (TPR) repeat protein